MMLIMKLLLLLKTIFSNNTSRKVGLSFSRDYSIVNERLSREQLYCLFPYLKKDGQLTDFHERHKQMFTVTDHMSSFIRSFIRSYRSRNNLPVSIPRYLTPESVCLLQSCMVSHYLLEKAGIHNIYSFSNTSGTRFLSFND